MDGTVSILGILLSPHVLVNYKLNDNIKRAFTRLEVSYKNGTNPPGFPRVKTTWAQRSLNGTAPLRRDRDVESGEERTVSSALSWSTLLTD